MFNTYKLGAGYIIFGEYSLDYLKTIQGDKVFIVTGGSALKRNGYLDVIINRLKEARLEIKIFDGIEADPKFSQVYEGSREMLEFEPDWIIGLGGGSAMDAAKAMWVLYENEDFTTIEQLTNGELNKKLREKARLICIPSTSGTGSEVTRAAVVSDDATHIKYALGDKQLRLVPDIAILAPEITMSMPKGLTAATGMDAVTHALETYISNKHTAMSDILSKGSYELAIKNIITAVNEPDNVEARANMLLASAVAGISFSNGGLGMCHSISHAIGGKYNVAHGLANAIILPHIVAFSIEKSKEIETRTKELAKISNEEDLVKVIKDTNKEVGIPSSFSEIVKGINLEDDLNELVRISLADGNTNNAPVVPSEEELRTIIRNCFK